MAGKVTKRSPRTHMTVAEVAVRLAHSVRWVQVRVARGELESFKWSPTDVTISQESVVRFEESARVGGPVF